MYEAIVFYLLHPCSICHHQYLWWDFLSDFTKKLSNTVEWKNRFCFLWFREPSCLMTWISCAPSLDVQSRCNRTTLSLFSSFLWYWIYLTIRRIVLYDIPENVLLFSDSQSRFSCRNVSYKCFHNVRRTEFYCFLENIAVVLKFWHEFLVPMPQGVRNNALYHFTDLFSPWFLYLPIRRLNYLFIFGNFLPPANEVVGRYCFHRCLSVILLGGPNVITSCDAIGQF